MNSEAHQKNFFFNFIWQTCLEQEWILDHKGKDWCLAGYKWRSSEKKHHLLPVQQEYLSMGLEKNVRKDWIIVPSVLAVRLLIAKHFNFLHQDFFQNFQLSCLFKYKLFRGEIDPYYYNFLTFVPRVKGEAFKQQHTVNAGVNWNTSHLNMPVIWHDLQIPSFSPSEPTHWINTVWMGNMNHKVSLTVLNAWQLAFLNIHSSKWFFFFT